MELSYDRERVKSAVTRNFIDVYHGLLKLTAYNRLCKENITCVGASFFSIAGQALYNDMLVNVFRALDLRPEADSFWYVERTIPVEVQRSAKSCNADIAQVREFSLKLLYVKNKKQVNIDRCAVKDSREVWHKAGISDDDFTQALCSVAGILAKLKQELLGGELEDITQHYDGSDIPRIIAAYEKDYGPVHGVPFKR